MWMGSRNIERKVAGNSLVAVAIDKDKGSQSALKWAVENILNRGQTVFLIHVKLKQNHRLHSHSSYPSDEGAKLDHYTKELFLPFRCFCIRKDMKCKDIILEDTDVVKALIEYVSQSAIEVLVLGASQKGGFLRRFKAIDIPGSITKGAPEFCTVYVTSKGKISSTRSASRAAPPVSPLRDQIMNQASIKTDLPDLQILHAPSSKSPKKQKRREMGEEESVRLEEKAQMTVMKLRENADLIDAIVQGNLADSVQDRDILQADSKGDKLIACLRDIADTLDQFRDIVQKCG